MEKEHLHLNTKHWITKKRTINEKSNRVWGRHVLQQDHTSECSNILSSKPTAVELFDAESWEPALTRKKKKNY